MYEFELNVMIDNSGSFELLYITSDTNYLNKEDEEFLTQLGVDTYEIITIEKL